MYKIIFAILCIMNVLTATTVLIPGEALPQNYATTYNALPRVENADELLKAQKCFPEFLEKFSETVHQFNLQNSVGLRLIHKHLHINDNNTEVMSEHFDIIDDVPSLITSPSKLTKNMHPASWILSKKDGTFVPFEFSDDKAVISITEEIKNQPAFIQKIATLIMGYGYCELMSLAILERETMSSINATEYVFMEKTSLQKGSIIQAMSNKDPLLSNAIKTSWSFSPRTAKWKCVPDAFCNKNHPDGHEPYYFHSYSK